MPKENRNDARQDDEHLAFSVLGFSQVIEWAETWVESETTIPECRFDRLTEKERAGLAYLRMMRGKEGA